ncbi:MAG: helix-turn-helix transcriptional regulator [Acidimicrobiia bacterium]|nr:helix-turn-helix transcriptional regulator [Acidimicrobiia bacterium]
MTPNQVAAWNLRRLRTQAGMTQQRLAGLMSHFGIPWTVFTVSDAELAVRSGDRGRSFTLDELALLALVFYVTPAGLLTPPSLTDTGSAKPVTMVVGDIEMSRETYLIDVLLHPSGVGARRFDGAIGEEPVRVG